MEIIFQIAGVLILFFLLKKLWGKYIQWQIVKKYNKLLSVLKEEKSKIKIEEYVSFLKNNINLTQDNYFKEKITNYTNLYSDHYKNGISALEIFTSWISNLKHEILHNPYNDQTHYRAGEYQSVYESENKNIFEKIEYQYTLNIRDGVNDESSKNKLFFLRLNNAIELFLSKYTKSSDTLLVFCWFDFFPFFSKHISKISYKTWFVIDSSLTKEYQRGMK